jgi:hypothetical protein
MFTMRGLIGHVVEVINMDVADDLELVYGRYYVVKDVCATIDGWFLLLDGENDLAPVDCFREVA